MYLILVSHSFSYFHFDTLNNILVNVNESPICFNLFNHYYMLKLFWF